MYKCPFCKSTDCEELRDHHIPQPNQPYFGASYSYNDDLVEMLCHDCGIVTKIDPHYYNTKDGESTNETK